MRLFPSVQQVSDLTPAKRDRSLDVIRLFSLVVVISGHGLMALLRFDGPNLYLNNLLVSSVYFQAFTWLLQVLPLFFFAGAASSVLGYKQGQWGRWLLKRAQRLYRPVFYYLAFWLVTLLILHSVLPEGIYAPIAGLSVQLLWFLGVYVLVLACMPLLGRITTGVQLAAAVAILYGAVALVDWTRLSGGPEAVGFLNFLLVWLIPAAMGVGYIRGLISRPLAGVLLAVALVVDWSMVKFGPYELSLVSIPGEQLSNMTPPSMLLAGHCIVLSCLAIVLAPTIKQFAQNARVWWLVAIGNSGAMTLYLWHMPALLLVHSVSHLMGNDRADVGQSGFWTLLLIQMAAFYVVVAVLFTLLYRMENLPLPWWDAAPPTLSAARGGVVGTCVVLAGILNLVTAKWGLIGPGIPLVIGMLFSLALARLIAGRAASHQTEVSGVPVGAK